MCLYICYFCVILHFLFVSYKISYRTRIRSWRRPALDERKQDWRKVRVALFGIHHGVSVHLWNKGTMTWQTVFSMWKHLIGQTMRLHRFYTIKTYTRCDDASCSYKSFKPDHTLKSQIFLTLIVPRAWEIGYKQPCIKCQGKLATHFVYFRSRRTLPYTHLEATSYIPQQGQCLHIWTTSLSTTGCYKNMYTIQFLWMACISRFAMAILSGEIELALGTIRVNQYSNEFCFRTCPTKWICCILVHNFIRWKSN